MATKDTSTLKVVMIPWLAHGHVSAFLELAKKLSQRNISVYFCSSPVNLASIKPRLAENSYLSAIHLVELHVPSLPELPPRYHTTIGLPAHLMPLLIHTFLKAGPSCITTILETIKPNLLIYDMMPPWFRSVELTLRSMSIPAVHFHTSGFMSLLFGLIKDKNITNPFPEFYVRESEAGRGNIALPKDPSPPSDSSINDIMSITLDASREFILVKSFQGMDGKYMDLLSELCKKKVVSVGPVLTHDSMYEDDKKTGEVFEWLNGREQCSTVFVAFGTGYFMSNEEMEELAHGLEHSNVNFIWVISLPPPSTPGEKTIKVEEILPQGFLERVKGRGKILDGWAPQARFLMHSSIGGFLSHCGWSSVMESLSFGVPIVAMPDKFDQHINARTIAELGVAVEILRDDNGDLKREEVAKVIREVVVEKSGEDVRRKAREVGEKITAKGDEDIDLLVVELQKLCNKYNAKRAEGIVDAGN